MACLEGRVVLVTGAGSGIGRETALLLAREGATVVCADLRPERAEETAAAIRQGGGRTLAAAVDVGRVPSLRRLLRTVVRDLGGLDALVNNAGVLSPRAFLERVTERDYRRVVDTDLKSVVFACKLALPLLRRRGGGAIVNIASSAAQRGLLYDPVYAAAKAGVVALTASLAPLGEEGIRVMCLCPGTVETALTEGAPPELQAYLATRPRMRPARVAAAVLELLHDGRPGEVRDVRPEEETPPARPCGESSA